MPRQIDCAIVGWGLAVVLAGQQPHPAPGEPAEGRKQPTLAAAQAAVDDWLDTSWSDDDARARVVVLLLEADGALQWFGELLQSEAAATAAEAPAGTAAKPARTARGEHLRQLATQVILGFVNRAHFSGVFFRGQYLPLAVMQPTVGEVLLELLLNPPGWFDMDWRERLVPALRDLMPRPPSVAQLLGAVAIVEDERMEPESLRRPLACLLWQWGRREFVEARLVALRRESAEGDVEDRLLAFRAMADLHYRLGDYERAAKTQDLLLRMAQTSELRVTPIDCYWSACYLALSGKRDAGLAALDRCAVLQASPDVDRSLKLPRSLFETDPEIASLRADPRFPEIVARAFPGRREDR